jgi:hypothetical protein
MSLYGGWLSCVSPWRIAAINPIEKKRALDQVLENYDHPPRGD